MSDNDLIAEYQERFRRGPVGLWTTSLGAGWDMCYGEQYEFKPDFTGRAYAYDSDESEEAETETLFTWHLVEDFAIETRPVGESACEEDWGIIRYDFRFALSKYGGDRILVLYQVDHYKKDNPGFWWSPNPVVLAR